MKTFKKKTCNKDAHTGNEARFCVTLAQLITPVTSVHFATVMPSCNARCVDL